MRKLWVVLAVVGVLVAGCGAKTKTELIAEAKLHEGYMVEDNYQAVYKRVVDKFMECSGYGAQFVQRNLYTELGEGEVFLFGAGGEGYVLLATMKKTGSKQTSIAAYSKVSTGFYPSYMAMVKMGAYNQAGCP